MPRQAASTPVPTAPRSGRKPGYPGAHGGNRGDGGSTDDHAQFQYYKSIGYFQTTPTPYADLGELAAGLEHGRENAAERTMAVNLGLTMDDMAVAPVIYRRARERGLGVWLTL